MAFAALIAGKSAGFAVDAAVVGGTALGYTVASGMLLRKTGWQPAAQMAVQGGVGVVSGLLVSPALPRVGLGLTVGGIVSVGQSAVRAMVYSRYLRQLEGSKSGSSTTSTTSSTNGSVAPGLGTAGTTPPPGSLGSGTPGTLPTGPISAAGVVNMATAGWQRAR